MPKDPAQKAASDRSRFLFRAVQITGALLIVALIWLVGKIFPDVNRSLVAFGLIFALLFACRGRPGSTQ